MQVSIKWLKDYIDFDWSAEELADRFTMAGVPVENVIRADEGLDKVVTGRIEKLTKHPDSDHLQICQMNVGEKELVQIITRRSNVAEGQVGAGRDDRRASAEWPSYQEGQAARAAVERHALLGR